MYSIPVSHRHRQWLAANLTRKCSLFLPTYKQIKKKGLKCMNKNNNLNEDSKRDARDAHKTCIK